MSDGINWEQLLRNGQLVMSVPEHRQKLNAYWRFYQGTAEADIFRQKYPAFVAEKEAEAQEQKPEEPATEPTVDIAELPEPPAEPKPEEPAKKPKGKKKTSPSADGDLQ